MNLHVRKVLVFGLQFVVLLLPLLCVYPRILEPYQAAVFDVGNLFLRGLYPRLSIHAEPDGLWRVNVDESRPQPTWFFTMGGRQFSQLVFLNAVLLPALLLATPAKLGVRVSLLGWGLIILFIVHVASVTACIYALARLCKEGSSLFCVNLSGILSPGGELSALAIWTFLTWHHWFPSRTSPHPDRRPKGIRGG